MGSVSKSYNTNRGQKVPRLNIFHTLSHLRHCIQITVSGHRRMRRAVTYGVLTLP